ncbi:MAG: DUF1565 domain-containing protein, partial [Deltaproteobacteria bacterium]|nr:DUF1565 domain-containing protein [Deltaproteobacteria bacterium]
DGDGFFPCVPPIDCADEDPVVWPGAPEIPGDGRDGDCDGSDLPLSDDHGVFVAVDGDDANPGTRQHPLRTIQLAVLQAEEQHKSVFVSAGTYRQSVSLPGGMGLYGGYAAGSWAYDWDANATIIEGVGEVAIGVRNRAGERTVVAGVVVRRQGTYGLKLQGAGRTVVLRSVFFSLPGAAPGVAIQALGESYLANLTVEDASSGIFLDVLGKEQTLLSSSIHAGQELALELRCEGAAEPTTAVIRSNVITGEGVGIVYYGYAYAYPVGYQYCRSTVLVEDNIVHAGAAMAIECDYHGRGLVLRRNDIRPVGNEGWSTAIRICTNAAMENNRIACSDQGSDVSAVYGGGRLTGNLVTCPGVHDRSIALHNMLEGALIANTIDGGAGRTAIGIEGICPVAVNNIITTSGGQERLCVIEKQMSAQHPATPTRLRNNDFFACPTALYRDRETGDIGDIRILNRMIDVAEVGGNISEDPRFVDRERGDYHLGEGSPCIDSGLELEQASTDIDGELRPRGAGFDIGADER